MLDVLTVQEIEMSAGLRGEELEAQFQARFNAPLIQAQVVQAVLEDPALAEQMKRENPAEWARVEARIARMKQIFTSK